MKLFKKITLLSIGAAMAIGGGVAIVVNNVTSTVANAASEKITDYTAVTSGRYLIGSTVSNADYYLTVAGNGTETGSKKGTATTDITAAQKFDITVNGSEFVIQFADTENYMTLASSKSNGNVVVQDTPATWTASNQTDAIRLSINNYLLQKNSGTSLNFGSYASGQKDLFLLSAEDEVSISGITAELKDSSQTFYVGDTVSVDDIKVTVNYSDSTSKVLTSSTGVTLENAALTTTGSNAVTVKYEHGEDTFTTTLNVTANAARHIVSYALTGDMTKKVYTVGEPWNFAGIKIEAVYNVGDNEVLGDLADLITDTSVVNEYDLSVSAPAVGVTSLTIENMVAYGGNDVDPITITGIVVNESSNSSVFDLTTTDNITSASTSLMTFASGSSTITFEKASATTNTNNYYPGTPNQSYNQTRAYKNSVGTFDAGLGETITTIEFVCHTDSYATALKNSTWTNGTAAVDSTNTKLVVVTATPGSQVVSVTFGNTVGFDTITINHADYNGPSIQIINAPTDDLQVGATGTLGYEATNATNPTVTWSSSDESVVTINETTGEWSALKLGSATITASITATEGSTSATAKINVTIGGHISIQEALNISTEIGSGKTTEYTVEVSGFITNLDDDNKGAGNERALRIADAKTGSEVSIMVYGIYSNNALRQYAIIGGYLTVRGNIQNYSGKAEITSPVVVAYEDAAEAFAKTAYESLNEACVGGAGAITSTQWSDLATAFNALTDEEKAKLAGAGADYAHNEDIAKWVARYNRCVNYGLSDFMGTGTGSNTLTTFSNSTVALIVAISAMTLLGAAVIIRRRKLVK